MNTRLGISQDREWKEKLAEEWRAFRAERNAVMVAIEEKILKQERGRVYEIQAVTGRKSRAKSGPKPKLKLVKNETKKENENEDHE